MKLILATAFVSLSCSMMLAYAVEKNVNTPIPATQQAPAKVVDSNITSWFMVLNENEIAAAKLALKKSTNPAVIKFADTMIKDHQGNLDEVKKVAKQLGLSQTVTPDVTAAKKDGSQTMAELKKLKGVAFDQAYANDMANGHAGALSKIDSTMMPLAQQTALKDYIKATREAVATHLEKAKALQNDVQVQGAVKQPKS